MGYVKGFKTRIINRLRYTLHDWTLDKRDANKIAKDLRERGCKARLVRSEGVEPISGKRGWSIYKRCT